MFEIEVAPIVVGTAQTEQKWYLVSAATNAAKSAWLKSFKGLTFSDIANKKFIDTLTTSRVGKDVIIDSDNEIDELNERPGYLSSRESSQTSGSNTKSTAVDGFGPGIIQAVDGPPTVKQLSFNSVKELPTTTKESISWGKRSGSKITKAIIGTSSKNNDTKPSQASTTPSSTANASGQLGQDTTSSSIQESSGSKFPMFKSKSFKEEKALLDLQLGTAMKDNEAKVATLTETIRIKDEKLESLHKEIGILESKLNDMKEQRQQIEMKHIEELKVRNEQMQKIKEQGKMDAEESSKIFESKLAAAELEWNIRMQGELEELKNSSTDMIETMRNNHEVEKSNWKTQQLIDKADFETKIENLKSEISSMQQDSSIFKKEAEATMNNLRSSLNNTLETLETKDNIITELKNQLSHEIGKSQTLQNELSNANLQLKEISFDFDKVMDEKDAKIEKLLSGKAELTNSLKQSNDVIVRMEQEKKSLQSLLEIAQRQPPMDFSQERDIQEARLKAAERTIRELHQTIDQLENQIKDLQTIPPSRINEEIHTSKSLIESTPSVVEVVTSSVETSSAASAASSMNTPPLDNLVYTPENFELIMTARATAEEKIASLEKELNESNQSLIAVKKRLKVTEAEYDNVVEQMRHLTDTDEKLAARQKGLEDALVARNSEQERRNAHLISLDNERSELLKQLSEKKELESELNNLRSQLEITVQSSRESVTKSSKLESELNQLVEENNQVKAVFKELTVILSLNEDKEFQESKEINDLMERKNRNILNENTLIQLVSKIHDLKTENEKLSENIEAQHSKLTEYEGISKIWSEEKNTLLKSAQRRESKFKSYIAQFKNEIITLQKRVLDQQVTLEEKIKEVSQLHLELEKVKLEDELNLTKPESVSKLLTNDDDIKNPMETATHDKSKSPPQLKNILPSSLQIQSYQLNPIVMSPDAVVIDMSAAFQDNNNDNNSSTSQGITSYKSNIGVGVQEQVSLNSPIVISPGDQYMYKNENQELREEINRLRLSFQNSSQLVNQMQYQLKYLQQMTLKRNEGTPIDHTLQRKLDESEKARKRAEEELAILQVQMDVLHVKQTSQSQSQLQPGFSGISSQILELLRIRETVLPHLSSIERCLSRILTLLSEQVNKSINIHLSTKNLPTPFNNNNNHYLQSPSRSSQSSSNFEENILYKNLYQMVFEGRVELLETISMIISMSSSHSFQLEQSLQDNNNNNNNNTIGNNTINVINERQRSISAPYTPISLIGKSRPKYQQLPTVEDIFG